MVVDSDHSDAFVLSKENGMSPASSDSELEVNETTTLGGVTEEKKAQASPVLLVWLLKVMKFFLVGWNLNVI